MGSRFAGGLPEAVSEWGNYVAGFSPEAGRWYGWQMLPGYEPDFVVPYFSPILVHSVRQRPGTRQVTIEFFNALYVEGMQGFVKDLSVIRRAPTYLVGALVNETAEGELSDRVAVVSEICPEWLRRHCPGVREMLLERPAERDLLGLQEQLNMLYGGRA